jgi:hypothetical protein
LFSFPVDRTRECGFSHTRCPVSRNMCEVNFVISVIPMYNMWCFIGICNCGKMTILTLSIGTSNTSNVKLSFPYILCYNKHHILYLIMVETTKCAHPLLCLHGAISLVKPCCSGFTLHLSSWAGVKNGHTPSLSPRMCSNFPNTPVDEDYMLCFRSVLQSCSRDRLH